MTLKSFDESNLYLKRFKVCVRSDQSTQEKKNDSGSFHSINLNLKSTRKGYFNEVF